ncbi:MAG: tetratricopeptide repeat protein [Acidobacteriota bacterium]|nr:tetratricopeptide repeat protein [Acidobacteriota bacterium]
MSNTDLPHVDTLLSPDEQRRFQSMLQRDAGRKFRLVVIQYRRPAARLSLISWIQGRPGMETVPFYHVDLAQLPGENLWAELSEILPVKPHKALIGLWNLENTHMAFDLENPDHQPPMMQQLNVQRDLLVRDFPVIWILFINPVSRHRLMMTAPDFCAFVTQWLDGLEDEEASYRILPLATPESNWGLNALSDDFFTVEAFKPIWALLGKYQLAEARDLLRRYDLEPESGQDAYWQRKLLNAEELFRSGWPKQSSAALFELLNGPPALEKKARQYILLHLCSRLIDRPLQALPMLKKLLETAGEAAVKKQANFIKNFLTTQQPDPMPPASDAANTHSENECRQQIERIENSLGPDHPNLSIFLNRLAGLLLNGKQYSEAELLYRRALNIEQTRQGSLHPDTAIIGNNLAVLLVQTNRADQAVELFRKSQDAFSETLGVNHPRTETVKYNSLLAEAALPSSATKVPTSGNAQ